MFGWHVQRQLLRPMKTPSMRLPGRGARKPARSPGTAEASNAGAPGGAPTESQIVDLERRRDELKARVAELQWDLGGLVYEMAVRDRVRVDVLIERAARLQDVDAELSEIERIIALEHSTTAGVCEHCKAPHSSGASFCWQCGQPVL